MIFSDKIVSMKKHSGEYVERRGGRRVGAGRKRKAVLATYSVDMTAEQAALLKAWGNGDISAGLRWLIDVAEIFVRRAI